MKTLFVYNPCSGKNLRRKWLPGAILNFITRRRLDARLARTEGPGHATQLVREGVAAGCSLVVAVGGDGTMNEVAQGLVGTQAALALVPCGSGNGLARHLGLPRGPLDALELAGSGGGRIAQVDTGVANGFPFFNAMGLGLDADVSQRFNKLTRRGLPAYAKVAWKVVRELRSERCTVRAGDRSETLDVLLVAVANSDQYGNDARIAPGARVDDGRLDLVAVRPTGLLGAAGLAARLFLGNVDRSAHVLRLGGPRFVIERAAPGLIHTDGETHETGARVEVEVRPGSLRVLVPAGSRAVATSPLPAGVALQTP